MGTADDTRVAAAIFKGTFEETKLLLEATERACIDPDRCYKDPGGKVIHMCAAHRALLFDQKFLDGVLFVRRDFDRWKHGEYEVEQKGATGG